MHIPSEQDEERRQPHRDLWTLKRDRTRVTNRIAGLLATVGVYVTVDAKLVQRLDRVMQWNGQPIPVTLRARVAREWEKVALFTTQIQALERARRLELCRPGFFAPYAIPTYPALLTLTVNRPEGSAMNENAPCSNDRKD